jgi:single-strand selective monofunctional uracil DNA glycosylase
MEALLKIERELSRRLGGLRFGAPVAWVYDPLTYAWGPHAEYVRRYAGPGRVLLLGMNPGPWGMAQTGVPFGAIPLVRDWLKIEGEVGVPAEMCPARPVDGFACRREEVSGTRVWGWARDRFTTPAAFFQRFYVMGWCPLMFLEASGRNRTPDQLPAAERAPLYAACDDALREMLEVLRPTLAVGMGGLAHKRLSVVGGVPIGRMPHPSPASPAANRGWAPLAEQALTELGVEIPGADL